MFSQNWSGLHHQSLLLAITVR